MKIELQNIGKKFRNEWIFRNLNYQFLVGNRYALTGHNGSGKSTLLQIISGVLPANTGNVAFHLGTGHEIPADRVQQHSLIAYAAPYMELIEEFTLNEAIDFHIKFKPFRAGLGKQDFIDLISLGPHRNKQIRQFSSGMKQRFKLGLAFYSQAEILLLDEPTTNLDETGVQWYLDHVQQSAAKIVIVSSNDQREYFFCKDILNMAALKNR